MISYIDDELEPVTGWSYTKQLWLYFTPSNKFSVNYNYSYPLQIATRTRHWLAAAPCLTRYPSRATPHAITRYLPDPHPHFDYKLLSLEKMATNSFNVPLYSHPRLVNLDTDNFSRAPVYRELEQMTLQTNSLTKYEPMFWGGRDRAAQRLATQWDIGKVSLRLDCSDDMWWAREFYIAIKELKSRDSSSSVTMFSYRLQMANSCQ